MAEKHDAHHDHGAHDPDLEAGGHEIDKMPNARLFNLLFGLSALTLLACIGVIQLFNYQVEAIEETRGEAGSFRVEAYRDEMRKQADGWGKVEVTIWTHKIDGLTESDFVLAAKIDRDIR